MSKTIYRIARYKGWRVVWHGGEYAEILPFGGRVPVDALNLWDHKNGRPEKDYMPRELRDMLRDWHKDNEDVLQDHLLSAGY